MISQWYLQLSPLLIYIYPYYYLWFTKVNHVCDKHVTCVHFEWSEAPHKADCCPTPALLAKWNEHSLLVHIYADVYVQNNPIILFRFIFCSYVNSNVCTICLCQNSEDIYVWKEADAWIPKLRVDFTFCVV